MNNIFKEDYFDIQNEEPLKGTCSECGEECIATVIDEGIGAYEYWGYRCVDKQLRIVSECCHAEIIE